MDYHIPRRPLGVRNPCVLCGGWSMAFPIDIEVFADDTHHVPLSVLLRMDLSVPYVRLLSLRMVSFVRGGDTYAMSRAYWRTWTSMLEILLICGGFSTASVMFHFRKKEAVAETFFAANVHVLPRRSARHFRAMSGKAHPPCSFGGLRVVVGTRKVAPFHINHVQIDVSCWMWRVGGGKTCARYHIFAKR